MSKISKRWLGLSLIAIAVIVVFVSTKLVDVPGPMEPSKPEFTFEFSAPFFISSIVMAFTGTAFVISSLRRKT